VHSPSLGLPVKDGFYLHGGKGIKSRVFDWRPKAQGPGEGRVGAESSRCRRRRGEFFWWRIHPHLEVRTSRRQLLDHLLSHSPWPSGPANRGGGQVCPSRTLSRLLSRKRESSRTHRSTSSRHPPPLLGAVGDFFRKKSHEEVCTWGFLQGNRSLEPRCGELCLCLCLFIKAVEHQ